MVLFVLFRTILLVDIAFDGIRKHLVKNLLKFII